MRREIGIRLHDLAPAPLERRLEMARAQGFSCVHLASKLLYAEYGIGRGGLTPGLAAHLRRVLDENELDVAVYGCYKNLANPNPAQLSDIVEEYEASMRFASWLGVGCVGTETGSPTEGYVHFPQCPEAHGQEALETFVANLRTVVGSAERFGVAMAIEPGWNEIVFDPGRTRYVLDEVSSANLGVIWDPVAQLSAENVDSSEAIAARMIELNGDDIVAMHAKDYVMEDGKVVCHAAGTCGAFDFSDIMRWQDEAKPHLQTIIENSTPDDAEASRDYLLGL
jgi:sugar phosphate isomerase/epimerase